MPLFGPDRVLAVDVGASQLKIGEFLFGRAGMELTGIYQAPLGIDFSDETDATLAIVDALQNTIKEKKIRPAPVVLSVTGQSAFLRLVKLPPVKRNKIYQTVLYEAQQNVPFPMNDVVWDYQLMGGSSETELNVMLVVIKKDIIENLTDCVEAVGLEVELVDVAPMALYNAVSYNYEELGECTLVIDIGARSTNLVFMEAGQFWSRNLPLVGSGNMITQQLMKEFDLPFKGAEELKFAHATVAFGGAYEDYSDKVISKVSKTVRGVMTRLHIEVERSINFYRTQQGGQAPTRILLAGGGSVIARTDEFFKEKTKVEVEYLNPFKNVIVNETITEDEIGRCAHLMGEVVGVGLRHALPCPLEINLIPPKIAAERAFHRKQPFLIAAAFGLVLVAFLWLIYFSVMAERLQEKRLKIAERVNQLEIVEAQLLPIEKKQAMLRQQIGELTDITQQRTRWLEILDGIHSCLPDGMWLVSLAPVKKTPAAGAASQPGGRSRRGVQSSAPTVDAGFNTIAAKGLIFADKATDKSIALFRDRLRGLPLFGEKTEIRLAPMPARDDFARSFEMEIELKEQL
ncbi:MAG: type IV pilus assembly protein PilM [Kiritimatiellia bacterium]|nr:type IV pilus assembly protein PilM [Kiritimatiellia bacterium]